MSWFVQASLEKVDSPFVYLVQEIYVVGIGVWLLHSNILFFRLLFDYGWKVSSTSLHIVNQSDIDFSQQLQ